MNAVSDDSDGGDLGREVTQVSPGESRGVAYLIARSSQRWSDVYRLIPPRDGVRATEAVLGRSSSNAVVIQSEKASRRHARVFWENGGGWAVQDLGSRNGTKVGNECLKQADQNHGQRTLQDGDQILIGGHTITFSRILETGSIDSLSAGGVTEDQITLDAIDVEDSDVLHRRRRSQSLHQSVRHDLSASLLQLAFQLGQKSSVEEQIDAVADRLHLALGTASLGIYLTADTPVVEKSNVPKMPKLMTTRQVGSRSYRRPPDALIQKSFRVDAESLLARNLLGDGELATANTNGEIDTETLVLTPIRDSQNRVWGVVHVCTSSGEPPLSESDLERVVAAGEILGESLASLAVTQQMTRKLTRAQRRLAALREQIAHAVEIIGDSPAMQEVGEKIELAAPTPATILVRGESGVGKELIAAAIHHASSRRDGPLVCLNCAALSPSLLESELFGHEKGAFTGATERKQGKFEAAHTGTLMLDEVGEMDADLQAKFLRVLEGHSFERVGGNRAITADVRVIAATNRDLRQMVSEGKFREDLYYRLHVVEIVVPPLRERRSDIRLLAQHFLKRFAAEMGRRIEGFSPAALSQLQTHQWPGNVRELKNVVERATVLSRKEILDVDDIQIGPVAPNRGAPEGGSMIGDVSLTLEEMQRRHIEAVLKHTNNNKSKSAKLLGIERSTLDRKLKRWAQDG